MIAADAAVAAGLALAAAPMALRAQPDAAGWAVVIALYLAMHAPLALRRAAPVTVFVVVLAVAVLCWGLGLLSDGYPLVVVLFVLYTVARHRPWRQLLPAAAAVALIPAFAWAVGELAVRDLVVLVVTTAAAALLGVYLKTRWAYVEQIRDSVGRQERERIAREMHDIVSHNVSVMVALADGAALTAAAAPDRAAQTLTTIASTGRRALAEMHTMLGLLGDNDEPVGRTPQPGIADLPELVRLVNGTGLTVTLSQRGRPSDPRPGIGLTVYRVVQEALTNAVKHSGRPARASVSLTYEADAIEVEVVDDGTGAPSGGEGGRGLRGMAQRVAAYGGTLESGPLPGRGWRVRARLGGGT